MSYEGCESTPKTRNFQEVFSRFDRLTNELGFALFELGKACRKSTLDAEKYTQSELLQLTEGKILAVVYCLFQRQQASEIQDQGLVPKDLQLLTGEDLLSKVTEKLNDHDFACKDYPVDYRR
jgi:hypothetical protein